MNHDPNEFNQNHNQNEYGEQQRQNEQQEPRWYGISYQNEGHYIPPVSYFEKEDKKKKRRRIALIATVALLCCALLVLFGIGMARFLGSVVELPPTGPEGDPTGGSGITAPSGGEVYEETTDGSYNYAAVTLSKNDGTGLADHPNGSAGDAAGTTISAAAKVKDAVVEILTTTTNRYQTIAAGVGSGVIIHADGLIVTNHHVVEGLDPIYVRLTNGNTYKATVRGMDEECDIAVIKIEPKETLTVASLGYSGALALGERVIAIGNPLGELGGTVTDGIISATQRAIQVDGITMTLIQTNAAINSGNSGGGLFNLSGELIGVVNSKIAAEGVEGLGFAIPIDTAIVSINHLLQLGYIPGTPALGVSVIGTRVQISSGFWPTYAFMPCVTESAGELQEGDLIYSINNTVLQAANAETALQLLRNAIRAYEVGEQITLKVYRNGALTEVTVTLVEYIPDSASVDFN